MARSTYDIRRAETLACRAQCAPIFLPLFDKCVSLAAASHARGRAQRAGRELYQARQVSAYVVCACGQPAIKGSELCSSHNPECWRVYDNGGKTVDRYSVLLEVSRWEGHTALYHCLGLSEGGRAFSQFREAQEGRHLGKRVKLDSLDSETRAHIGSRLSLAATMALR
jgi:hypothetical protein